MDGRQPPSPVVPRRATAQSWNAIGQGKGFSSAGSPQCSSRWMICKPAPEGLRLLPRVVQRSQCVPHVSNSGTGLPDLTQSCRRLERVVALPVPLSVAADG
jgi:hypothetical protein